MYVGGKELSAGVSAIVSKIVWISLNSRIFRVSVIIHHDIIERVALDHLATDIGRELFYLFPNVCKKGV